MFVDSTENDCSTKSLLLDAQQAHPDTAPDRFNRWVWWFLALGIALRVGRYLLNYPLWWDEAFLAVNLIRRDYFDLLRPLDYGQVCPFLFLWAELAVVRLLDFSEWSLRLVPLLCAVVSVPLFVMLARRVLSGVAVPLAVAIFACSYHPIRHAADVKPYASDLLVALILLLLAVNWRNARQKTAWLYALALTAPFALALSYPSIFILGAIGILLAWDTARSGRRSEYAALAAFATSTGGSFLLVYLVSARSQTTANLGLMQAQWGAAFPPLPDPIATLRWLLTVHTGSMFAYPCGADRGGSAITFILFVVGSAVLWKRGNRRTLLLCLLPFALTMLAAAIKRYPYGGVAHGSPARVMQFLAPAICLLAAAGAAWLMDRLGRTTARRRACRFAMITIAAIGLVSLITEAHRPYRSIHAQRAREFARTFWPEVTRDAVSVCVRADLDVAEWDSINLNVAVYLCNQRIYRPASQPPPAVEFETITNDRPLRVVVPLCDSSDQRVSEWLGRTQSRLSLKSTRILDVSMSEDGARPRTENYVIHDFVPKASFDAVRRSSAGMDTTLE